MWPFKEISEEDQLDITDMSQLVSFDEAQDIMFRTEVWDDRYLALAEDDFRFRYCGTQLKKIFKL